MGKLREYIRKVSVSGYLPPPPTRRATKLGIWIGRFLIFVQVGRVHVQGKEYLNQGDHGYVIAANHPHYADPLIIASLLNRSARYMVHEDVFSAGFGLGALIFAPMGAFVAQDSLRDYGTRACDAGSRILTSAQTLVMFPEGYTSFDTELLPVRKGAHRILKQAEEKLERACYLVPAHIQYGRYPGKWIRRFKRPVQYLIVLLGFWHYRRGAAITIGEPVRSDQIPDHPKAGIDFIMQRILSLDPDSKADRVKQPEYK